MVFHMVNNLHIGNRVCTRSNQFFLWHFSEHYRLLNNNPLFSLWDRNWSSNIRVYIHSYSYGSPMPHVHCPNCFHQLDRFFFFNIFATSRADYPYTASFCNRSGCFQCFFSLNFSVLCHQFLLQHLHFFFLAISVLVLVLVSLLLLDELSSLSLELSSLFEELSTRLMRY